MPSAGDRCRLAGDGRKGIWCPSPELHRQAEEVAQSVRDARPRRVVSGRAAGSNEGACCSGGGSRLHGRSMENTQVNPVLTPMRSVVAKHRF